MSNGIYFSLLLFAMIFLTRYGLLLKHSFRYGGHAEAKLLLKIILRFFSHKNEMLKIVPENCRSLVDLFMCENFQCSKRLLADYCCMFFTSLSVLPSREFLPYFYVSISYIVFSWSSRIALQCFWMQYSTLLVNFPNRWLCHQLTSKIIFCLI